LATIGTDIEEAAKLLAEEHLVGIPTETVYGLAANALNPSAVLKIFKAKNRPAFDPLIVHIRDLNTLDRYVESQNQKIYDFLLKVWPGPVTILLKKKQVIPDITTSGLDTVGIRIPDHPMTLRLLSQVEFPLAAPSANIFGYVSPTTANHVNEGLGNSIQYILDGGPCKIGVESSVISFEKNGPVIHRIGGLTPEIIQENFPDEEIQYHLNQSSNPKAPGTLRSHYAPKLTLVADESIENLIKHHRMKRKVTITFSTPVVGVENNINFVLSRNGDLAEAAMNLFDVLRQADQLGAEIILAEYVPDEGLGMAINDRLRRAASKI